MHFTKITLSNYGIYKGTHTISLESDLSRNVTLVGGMNGRGKTTILDSIFLCLYGRKASEYITGKKEAYSKTLSDRINKSATAPETFIRLDMCMDEEDSTLSVCRSWKRNGKKIDSSLSVIKNNVLDEYLAQNWEYYVEELIPFGIAKFFFFDNEKISQIADDEAFDKVKDSIKSVMGVTTIESLCGHINKIIKSKSDLLKSKQTSSSQEELLNIEKQLEDLTNNLRLLHEQRAGIVPNLEKVKDAIEQTEQLFWKKGGNLALRHDDIIREQNELKLKVSSLREEAIQIASSPIAPLCLCRELVSQTYNSILLREETIAKRYSYPVLQKMYSELLRQIREKLNNPKDTDFIKQIMDSQLSEISQTSLSENTSSLSPIAKEIFNRIINYEYSSIITKATQIIEESNSVDTALAQLEVHLSSTAEKADASDLLEKIKSLEAEKATLEVQLTQCDEAIHSASFEEEQVQRAHTKILQKIASEADTIDDNARILEYSTMTLEVMQEFTNRLQKRKVALLEENITRCFKFLAQKEAMITSISINPSSLDITLKDYAGGTLLKNQLSAGEKQMFAISILWGLALSSGYKLPVIIDTPMARLDSAHRTNFINKYLPNASSQVVVLSTDEEVIGKYLDDIRSHVSNYYTLVYDEDAKCSSIQTGYFGGEVK